MKNKNKIIPVLMITGVAMVTLASSPLARNNFIVNTSANSGANIERSLTITGFEQKGLYYYNRNRGDSGYFDRYWLYQLENPGSYSVFKFNFSTSHTAIGQNGRLLEFIVRSGGSSGDITFQNFDHPQDYYYTQEDLDNKTNKINFVDFENLQSIHVKMSSDNEGEFDLSCCPGTLTFDEETNTYIASNLANYTMYPFMILKESEEKLISIESITLNYVC